MTNVSQGGITIAKQIAVDHMVVTKSSGGREFLVLIVHDSFSGIVNAYPAIKCISACGTS